METYNYLIHLQFLGFRFHGWQKQPGVKTVESMMEKTLGFVLGHGDFKLLGASRTDAMVSAARFACELILRQPVDPGAFSAILNQNLPNDIRVAEMTPAPPGFNIRQSPRFKAYIYLFAFGQKPHPFSAPLMATFQEHLDVERMEEGAGLFRGIHDFSRYCTKPGPDTQVRREIFESRIEKNSLFTANFFPEPSYAFRVKGKGFMRNQVRLMMGQLIRLGRGEISPDDIRDSLKGASGKPLPFIAPASGLVLHQVQFNRSGL